MVMCTVPIHWASESHPTPPEVQIHAVGLGCCITASCGGKQVIGIFDIQRTS
jgi:hypothetical protein